MMAFPGAIAPTAAVALMARTMLAAGLGSNRAAPAGPGMRRMEAETASAHSGNPRTLANS